VVGGGNSSQKDGRKLFISTCGGKLKFNAIPRAISPPRDFFSSRKGNEVGCDIKSHHCAFCTLYRRFLRHPVHAGKRI